VAASLRILHLEDQLDDAELVRRALSKGGIRCEVCVVTSKEEYRKALQTGSYDVILADYTIAGFDGPNALEILRSLDLDLPFIFVTGRHGEELAIESLKAGATDYVLKAHLSRLVPSVTRAVEEAQERMARRGAEAALRATQRQLQAILDHSPALISIKDVDGRIVLVNRQFDVLSTTAHAGYVGRALVEVFPPEVAIALWSSDRAVLDTGGPIKVQEALKHRDGTVHQYLSVKFPVLDDSDQVFGVGVISTDLSERILLEAQLRQSQKLEAIGQLAGGVAHDFNNVLQAVFTHVDLALRPDRPPERITQSLRGIREAAERAAALTRQLLSFSRRQVLQPRNLDINELIAGFAKMLRRIIGEDMELVLELGSDVGFVHADPGQVEQVIMNLVVNARDAMPEGGEIVVETSRMILREEHCQPYPWVRPGGWYVEISVSDQGIGMDEFTKERVFEPFFTTKGEGKGTGLGLSTVYAHVRQHEGFVEVESELGVGSTFLVYLPLVEGFVADFVAPLERPDLKGTETILVAEDDAVVRALTEAVLVEVGYTVVVTSSGDEATDVFAAGADAIDLVLLDVVMPGKGGREVYDHIKQIRDDIRVLFTTGYSTDSVHARFLLEQKMNLLPKPYGIAELLQKVRETLDRNPDGD
jgi:two-component system cell cycle sensor histidine kinase/response regulator CckA